MTMQLTFFQASNITNMNRALIVESDLNEVVQESMAHSTLNLSNPIRNQDKTVYYPGTRCVL